MDYKNIQELIKTVSNSELTSFEIETEGIRIKMEKKEQQVVVERMPINTTPIQSVIQGTLTRENIATNQVSVERLDNNIASTIENEVKIIPRAIP